MENLALLVVDLMVLSGTIFLLHSQRGRIGFTPLMMCIGGLTALLELQIGLYFAPFSGVRMFVNPSVIVPVILAAVLIFYVVNGTVPARLLIFSILGVSLLTYGVMGLYQLHIALPGTASFRPADTQSFTALPPLRTAVASLSAFTVDMFVIAIAYQGLHNLRVRLPEWLIVGLALLASLWADAIVFGTVSYIGTPTFLQHLPGDLTVKTISAAIMWPLTAFYLSRLAPKQPDYVGSAARPTFDLFFGTFEQLKLALVSTEKALADSEIQRRLEAEKVKMLRDFISEASHDLKTPLSSVNVKIYQLARTEDVTLRQKYLDDLQMLSSRLGDMINDLLTLARLDEMVNITVDRLDLNLAIQSIVISLQPQIEEKHLDVVLDLTEDMPLLHCDQIDLSRALGNLIDNAVRYTQIDGRITIRTEVRNAQIIFTVQDTGIGIAETDIPHIFDRFYRAELAAATDPGGTGLGLAIVKKIVEQHKGRVTVESQLMKGTTFMIVLPFHS